MSYFLLRGLSLFLSGLVLLFMPFLNVHAQTASDVSAASTTTATTATSAVIIEKPVIVTAVPAPKDAIVTPTGFANCFTVKAGWYQDVWIAEHRVCQYQNTPSGVAWVEGYWTCTKYNISEAQCTHWEWKTARWEKTLTIY